MHKDVLEFIDSPDIRTFHQKTVFTPAQQAVLVIRSGKKTVDEKIEMLEYLMDIPTVGIILGIKPDTENRWDNDEYWFDSDMNLIEISGRNERYQISKNKTVQPVFSYAFHLELPFHVGDIVKAESFQRPPLWGVIYYEWEKPKKPEFCTMNIWLDFYELLLDRGILL